MATWIAHLRVAENILNKGFKFDKIPFVVGNIGPDAGMPNEDWSKFSPPTEVTHWKTDKIIEPEKFWDKYLKNLNSEDNFIYLNEEEMDMFVNRASANIIDMLSVDLRR